MQRDRINVNVCSFLRACAGPGRDVGRRFYVRFRQAVWNNDGDVAVLVDRTGRVVARYAWGCRFVARGLGISRRPKPPKPLLQIPSPRPLGRRPR